MEPSQPEKDISLIKNLMEKSSKFSNLSGYAIATTGLLALLGAVFVYFDLGISISEKYISYAELINQTGNANSIYTKIKLLVIIASLILLTSLLILYVSAKLKSERHDINLFNSSFSRALKSLFIPVLSGGIFCGFLILHKMYGLVAPATLIFYGLGLISASKYSYRTTRLSRTFVRNHSFLLYGLWFIVLDDRVWYWTYCPWGFYSL